MTPRTWHECRAAAVNTVCALFYQDGLALLVLRGPHSLCSYVGVPGGHPLYGADRDLLDISVCGGLNFMGKHGEGANAMFPPGFYFYGWSHDHRNDASFERDPRPEEIQWDVPTCCAEMIHALPGFQRAMKLAEHAAPSGASFAAGRVAQLKLAQRLLLEAYDRKTSLDHAEDCPGDDTCECENIARLNAALEGYQP